MLFFVRKFQNVHRFRLRRLKHLHISKNVSQLYPKMENRNEEASDFDFRKTCERERTVEATLYGCYYDNNLFNDTVFCFIRAYFS